MMRMHGFSLKTKMATVVSVLFLFIFAAGALMFESTFEEHFKKTVADQQFELTSKIARDIDTQIKEAQKILISVSRIIPIDDLNNYPAMQKHLEKIVETRFFIRTFFDNGILLYSKTGRVIGEVPYSPERYGKDLSYREYFQYTAKTRVPYISKPYRSIKPPFDPVVMFTVPIFNRKGELAAILGGSVSLTKDTFLGGIAKVKIGRTGYMYLYNADRTIIVHPDKTRVLQKDMPPGANRLFDKAINEWFEGSGETVTSRGLHVIGTFKRFQNTDWILAANYPVKEAYAPLLKERWYMAGYTALGIFLSILIILIVMRRSLSPLSHLASQAEAIGRADERLRSVSVETGGEIGALAFSFNEMLKRLHDREASLKRTLEDLKEREARISSIMNTTVDGIITIDEDRIIESFNQAAEKIFGYAADEVIGRNVSILMPDPHQSRNDQYVQAYLKGARSKVLGTAREVLGRRKNGTMFPVELSISEADLGNRRIFTGILRDITERKKAEEELQKLYRAVEHSSAVVIITDTDGAIEYVNPKFIQVTGYEKTEVFGQTPRILRSGETSQETYRELWDTITSGEEWQGIFHNKKKNGEFYWVSASISPLKDTSGAITHFVGIQEDITAIKLYEQELQKAKEAAESANQAKSDFLAVMSHEIRTPMNVIIGMAELMMETPLNDEQKRYAETLMHAGENLLNIINDILDISKIEAGYLELEATEFNLQELLDKACGIMAIRARDKGIGLSCNVLSDVPVHLIGDPHRLGQVILNLLGNAVKFTDNGEVVLEVNKEASDTTTLLFSIRDTGIGIPDDKVSRIFEKFTQADSSTTRKYGGTGLGLTISKRLVELMGGRIWVSSSVGVGSTFYFTANFQLQKERPQTEPAAVAAMPEREILRPLRILLVDDSEDNRLLILSFLKKTPFVIDIADNGLAAVEKYKTATYDLVLMDIQMPVMDGYTATKEVRDWERSNNREPTPVLALTAYAFQEEIRKSYDAGFNGHLTKPIKKNDLLYAIAAYTKKTSAHKQYTDKE